MTIAERQAREAHDRENPWRPIHTARRDYTICNLLFNDLGGDYPVEEHQYFLDADGSWYQIDPPAKVWRTPINWRAAYVQVRPERRRAIKRACDEMDRGAGGR